MLSTRIQDDPDIPAENGDFTLRKRPLGIQLSLAFLIAFLVICATGLFMNRPGGAMVFYLTLIGTIGSLAWFTIFSVTRNNDLVLTTEFMNTLLASAARLGVRFCLIAKTDGSIVYVDPGFQKTFPDFTRSGSQTALNLLANLDPDTESETFDKKRRSLTELVERNESGSIVVHFRDASGRPGLMKVSVDVLPRPKGYLLLRGRDYVEKRRGADTVQPVQAPPPPVASPAAPADHSPTLSHFITSSPLAIARLGAGGTVSECNPPLRELVRQSVRRTGWPFSDIVSTEDRAAVNELIKNVAGGRTPDKQPLEIMLAAGEGITASLYVSRIEGETPEIIAQLIDTSEQKNLEQRFAHSQKMQAVGQLAGGVAHDFNNLLTAMIGFCDLLLMRHPAGDQSFADIMQIKQNANRAANLVRQLLAFSRRQTLQPKSLDITDVLAELSNLVRRLIGENIELKVIHGRDLGMVKADQGQLEQVFINLAVNARDAMPGGGKLTIQSSHVTIDRKHPIGTDLVPPVEDEAIVDGDYVLVEVIDTGTGIPRDLLQKIFEPFFSTKEVGSGTGLGLATVYGIIKQTGGYVYVASKEGAGTNFSLFFKRYLAEEAKPAVAESPERAAGDDLTGKGTVLLVEDEAPVRMFAARALRNKGYTVLEADCGETAIEVMTQQGGEVDVVVTDVIMPGINGPAMIETIAPQFPRVKVIFISGYAEDIFVKSYGSERAFNFLPKPFTLKQLASKVKEVLQQ